MMHQSIATIDSPEFINLQPLEINPLMSGCEIKVLYLGENRNGSFINKEVATEMAKTLRGAPIVGYYKEDKEDFRDHGEKVIMDDEGLKFECMTKPYGFVAPDAKVWFQKFEDTDDFGNKVEREYLMTTGYLWTGQYEEAKLALSEGRPQSMELDEDTLDGKWAVNNNTGMEFFIINDAIFSKLCILGEDVEPCFEGASITAPEVSSTFTKIDDNFKKTLFTMMQDLKFALEGGKNMVVEENKDLEEKVENVEAEKEEETKEDLPVEEDVKSEATEEKADSEAEVEEDAEPEVTEEASVEENINFSKNNADEEKEEEKNDNSDEFIPAENENSIEAIESEKEENNKTEEVKEENPEKDYSLIEKELEDLKVSYSNLEAEYKKLVDFKAVVDNEKKDALINSFYMLSDEDKKDVIENKANYSLEDIEAKLSVICVRKKVNFDLENTSKNDNKVEEEKITTYNISNDEIASAPAWITALKNTRDKKNN